MFSRRALLLYIFLTPVFVVTLLYSIKYMFAAALVVEPRHAMEKWACDGKVDDMEQWQNQKEKLERANNLHVGDAEYVSDLGRIHELKALSVPAWNTEAREMRGHAVDYYRQATSNSPTWSMAWLNLAQSKILNQETDDEAFKAIRKSFRFGRWQIEVQQRLLYLTIGVWPVLPSDIKESILSLVSEMLEKDHRVDNLIFLAFRYSWQQQLRPLLTREEHIVLYESYEKNPDLLKKLVERNRKSRVC